MSVTIRFECNGCDAASDPVPVASEFVSVSGRSHGFGRRVVQTVAEVTPEGWVGHDPYTGMTYCPECWASIVAPKPEEDPR